MTPLSSSDVRDLDGRTAVVTGANSGIGLETTRALAAAGAEVVLACRDRDRAVQARDDVAADVAGADLRVLDLDLADLDSIAGFADAYAAMRDDLDLLINNAGVMAIPRKETADGFEYQLGVNHLGHFALTGHLLDALRAAEGRVVTVSSGAHRAGRIDFEDLHAQDGYQRWGAYSRSKLANLLFAFELDRRLEAAGAAVESVAAHPGWAATNLQRRSADLQGSRLKALGMAVANRLFAQSAAAGAQSVIHAATAEVEGGDYYGPTGFFGMRGAPGSVEPASKAREEATARRLWKVSERETGVEYSLPAPGATETAPGVEPSP